MRQRTKYKLMIALERVNNRLTRAALRRGWAPRFYALLETTGRRSGMPRHTPVGAGMRPGDAVFWLIAPHGRRADYVRNIERDPRVRVRVRGVWHAGVAQILPDDDTDARSRILPYQWDAAIGRLMASDPLTIRIDLS